MYGTCVSLLCNPLLSTADCIFWQGKKVTSVSVTAVSLHFTTALKAWPRRSACSGMLQERMIRVFLPSGSKIFNIMKLFHVGTPIVLDPDPVSGFNGIPGSGSGFTICIRIQEGKNDPQKYKNVTKFHFLNAGCSLLGAEDFSCCLDRRPLWMP